LMSILALIALRHHEATYEPQHIDFFNIEWNRSMYIL
jgi:hypothetical protein